MLRKGRSLGAYHGQAAVHSFNALCAKPLASMMTAMVIAIALALPAFFWALTDNVDQLTLGWQRAGHISLYLKPALSDVEQIRLLQKIRETPGVKEAVLKSPAEGLAELTQQEGMQDIMNYLPQNPLPAVINVTPVLTVNSTSPMENLYTQLAAFPEVDDAKLDMAWIKRLHAILGFIGKATNALLILLSLAVVFIIGNTLRLAIHHRREEIQILKLIGATDPFILRPFLYSGVWFGLIGGLLSVLLVNISILSLGLVANQLAEAYQMHYPLAGLSLEKILLLILFATIIGWLGARLSVKRQIASIEPYN